MNLPVSIPLWQAVFGALVAMVAVKGLFGGIGKNFANPAITARIVMFLAFSKTMTALVFPDAVSSATPLAMMANGESVDYLTLLLGCLLYKSSERVPNIFVNSPIGISAFLRPKRREVILSIPETALYHTGQAKKRRNCEFPCVDLPTGC